MPTVLTLSTRHLQEYEKKKKLVHPNYDEIENLFQAKVAKAAEVAVVSKEDKKPQLVELLDQKRAQSLNMFLGSLHMPWQNLIKAVVEVSAPGVSSSTCPS